MKFFSLFLSMNSDGYNVRASWLRHRVACFGYCIQEPDSPGTLNSQKLKELGVPPGPLYGQLKQGHSVVSPHGTMVWSFIYYILIMGKPESFVMSNIVLIAERGGKTKEARKE